MNEIGTGAGLGALGFWLFIAATVVGGIWYDIRKKQAQHETLRRLIDRGEDIDEALIDKLLSASDGSTKTSRREMRAGFLLASTIVMFLAPGLMVVGLALGAFIPLTGVAALLIFLAFAFRKIADSVADWYGQDGKDGNSDAEDDA